VINTFPEYGRCSAGYDVHHIRNKGAGGDDTAENLVTLCRRHHMMAQLKKIPPIQLETIAKTLNAIWETFVGKVPDARN